MKKLLVLVLSVSLFSTLTLTLPAAADTSPQSITLSPTSQVITVQPGESHSGKLQLINQGAKSTNLNLYGTAYRVTDEQYDQSFTPLPGAPNPGNWLSFGQTKVTIEANGNTVVPYTLTVPAKTPAGGYYAVAFAETQTDGQASSSDGLLIQRRVGTIFYITVGGDVHPSGKILSWQSAFLQKPPVNGVLRISNTSSVHFPVAFTLTVKDVLGNTKFSQTTNKEILPQTIRRIPLSWQGAPPIGLVKVGGSVQYLGQTKYLPTHWVIVASPTARKVIVVVALALLLWFIVPPIRNRRKTKKPYKK